MHISEKISKLLVDSLINRLDKAIGYKNYSTYSKDEASTQDVPTLEELNKLAKEFKRNQPDFDSIVINRHNYVKLREFIPESDRFCGIPVYIVDGDDLEVMAYAIKLFLDFISDKPAVILDNPELIKELNELNLQARQHLYNFSEFISAWG